MRAPDSTPAPVADRAKKGFVHPSRPRRPDRAPAAPDRPGESREWIAESGHAAWSRSTTGNTRPAPGTSGALLARSARDALSDQTRQSGHRIELRHAHITRVHDDAHALDGEAGLGDGRGQHHAPLFTRLDRAVLGFPRQIAVERMYFRGAA